MTSRTPGSDVWLSPQELADMLGIPVRTVYYWRSGNPHHGGPRGHVIGKHVRFRMSDVETWLAEQADRPKIATG